MLNMVHNQLLKSKSEIVEAAKQAGGIGAAKFGIVTSGNRLSDKENPFPVKPRYYGGKPLFEVSELDALIDSLER